MRKYGLYCLRPNRRGPGTGALCVSCVFEPCASQAWSQVLLIGKKVTKIRRVLMVRYVWAWMVLTT